MFNFNDKFFLILPSVYLCLLINPVQNRQQNRRKQKIQDEKDRNRYRYDSGIVHADTVIVKIKINRQPAYPPSIVRKKS